MMKSINKRLTKVKLKHYRNTKKERKKERIWSWYENQDV